MDIEWACKSFTELSPQELYSILELRNEVFVVEQNCVFQDCDNKDQDSYHFMGWHLNNLVAYSRIMPAGLAFDEVSIGRVATSLSVRRKKIGKELMVKSIDKLNAIFGEVSIKIGAQLYLQPFYESLGFKKTGNIYLEDGIEHIKMIRT